mgnify:CR=1 FL=1
MARGYLYEIAKDAERLFCMDADEATLRFAENEFEWSEDLDPDEPREDLLEVLEDLGAKIGIDEEGKKQFQLSEQVKKKYFQDRFYKMKQMVGEITLETFSSEKIVDLQEVLEESYDNAVYLGDYGYDKFLSFDRFIREAETDAWYYVGSVILMH